MRKILLLLPLLILACEEGPEKAQRIVDKAIEQHGVATLDRDTLAFKFREHRYVMARDSGRFRYERHPVHDSVEYHDVLTNEGFTRYRNGDPVDLSQKDSTAYAASLNSVIYFAFLPYRLNDPAVLKSYEGTDSVEGKAYHTVRVSFKSKGGGKDHEDEFLYWFHQENGRMDYFAYRYYQDGGGVRFRKAIDPRRIDGLLVQSYRNFKAPMAMELHKLDEMWEKGGLEQVSEIRTEKVEFL